MSKQFKYIDTSISKNEAANKFNFDARVFILSLKDAIHCTKQISEIESNRYFLNKYIEKFDSIVKNQKILIEKYTFENDKEVYNEEKEDELSYKILKGNKENIYLFSLYNEAFNFYSYYINNFEKKENFSQLNSLLTNIENQKKNELKSVLRNIKYT